MWSWNQFRNLPRNQVLSTQEQARQYFIHQSNMMMEATENANAVATSVAVGSGGGSIKKVYLSLVFNDILNADSLVGDASNLENWNEYFDLPNYGNPFTSVQVISNEVRLFGASNITMRVSLFTGNNNLIEIIDTTGCIINSNGYSFNECYELKTIDLPELLDTGLDSFAYSCSSLINVNLPKVTNLGIDCFAYCYSLTEINLPKLETTGIESFYGCSSLTSVDLPEVLIIGDFCFSGCPLINVNLPKVTNLGSTLENDGVFSNIKGNTISITINESVLNDKDLIELSFINQIILNGLPYQTFSGYSGDLSLEFDDILSANALVGDASNVEDWNIFFSHPLWSTPFTDVEITLNTIKLIGGENIVIKEYLFNSNFNIISIIDNGCISYLGSNCFENCLSLTSVDLPNLTIASNYCFGGCSSISSINLPELENTGYNFLYYCISLTNVDLPNLTTTGTAFFDSCTSLIGVNLPKLKLANNYFFSGCLNLTTVNVPILEFAGDGCFGTCLVLTQINLPQLKTAGEGCFAGSSSLNRIEVPLLETIGGGCFGGCESLSRIDIPQLITAGDGCFGDCSSLIVINIPSCQNLGSTIGEDYVFLSIIGKNITLTIPIELMTINDGEPDGDIVYLQENNIVTIIN